MLGHQHDEQGQVRAWNSVTGMVDTFAHWGFQAKSPVLHLHIQDEVLQNQPETLRWIMMSHLLSIFHK